MADCRSGSRRVETLNPRLSTAERSASFPDNGRRNWICGASDNRGASDVWRTRHLRHTKAPHPDPLPTSGEGIWKGERFRKERRIRKERGFRKVRELGRETGIRERGN